MTNRLALKLLLAANTLALGTMGIAMPSLAQQLDWNPSEGPNASHSHGASPAPAPALAPAPAQTPVPAAVGAPAPVNPDDPYQLAVRADRRALDPALAVRQEVAEGGRSLRFATYCNYLAFVSRAEIRIFAPDAESTDATPMAVVPVGADGKAAIAFPTDLKKGSSYVLRVYGAKGAWDETHRHALELQAPDKPAAVPKTEPFGHSDDAGRGNISLSGITLTVQGKVAAQHQSVRVNGRSVPVSDNGTFVSEQIIPAPTGIAHIEILDGNEAVLIAERRYDASSNRWFVVAQGDITFSHAVSTGPAVDVSGDPLASGDHFSSRGAFYAKGTLGKDIRVTASLDTGETLLKDMFSNIDRKDPTQLLRRVDDAYHYPTFGDGSTTVEDAPSQGRFYLRMQKNDSNLVIGNFITAAQGTELVQLDRGLFGVMLDYKSQKLTSFGERKRQLLAFASDPGTITSSDELRGTGGSLYYLHHQDLSVGSERVLLEVRSSQTGAVIASTALHIDQDYEIDYFQGRITLLRPLSSYLPTDELVQNGSSTGNVPVLVARYEYTPPEGSITGHSIGGRASQWFGNVLRLGVTGQSETAAPANQLVMGGDAMLRASASTWLKGEYGRTDGPGYGASTSLDGGLNYTDASSTALPGQVANAWRAEGSLDEADLSSKLHGKASGFYETYQAGYAGLGEISQNAMHRWGSKLEQQLTSDAKLNLSYEGRVDDGLGANQLARGEWTQILNPSWQLRTGLRWEDIKQTSGSPVAQGKRLDGAVKVAYDPTGAALSAYVFGQDTLDRDETRARNDRAGAGAKLNLTKQLSAEGEVSDGSGGWAANADISRRERNGSETHLGYRLYSDVTDHGYDPQDLMTSASRGQLVLGSRQTLTDTLTLTGEEKYGHGGTSPSLSHSYGLRFAPDKQWSFGSTFEKSTVFAGTPGGGTGGIDRLATTLSAGYSSPKLNVTSAVEYRDDKQTSGEQTSWLFKDKLDVKPDPDWRLMASFDYAFTNVANASLQAANYTEAIAGFAYRPTSNDRLNVLARYTYLRDMGPSGQIMSTGGTEQPKQISQVVSLDISYDLTNWFTLGGKYAWREGQVSLTRASDVFVDSGANLYALRGDIRFARNWDFLGEARMLQSSVARDRNLGFLAALYRHLGKDLKIGVGYNFTDYSTDLTDQSYTTRGIFMNMLAMY